jgi:hypothetical protein
LALDRDQLTAIIKEVKVHHGLLAARRRRTTTTAATKTIRKEEEIKSLINASLLTPIENRTIEC